jgi:hypothetical protein
MSAPTGIEYQSFEDFRASVQDLVAPEELAENMEIFFREQVSSALSDVQTLIPWYRRFNLNIITKDDVREFCAASIFQGPVGKVTNLFAYLPGKECKKFYYKRVKTSAIDCWMEHQKCVMCNATTPPSTNIYESPYCNYVILGQYSCDVPYLTATEDDCQFKSLSDEQRMFAVGPDYTIYAAPRFPCGYLLFLQWQGIRRKWSDTAAVPVDQQLREAVVQRVERNVARKEHNWVAAREFDESYTVCMRTLKYRYHDEQDPDLQRDCTAALEQAVPAFFPLYAPTDVAVEQCINESLGSINGDDILES